MYKRGKLLEQFMCLWCQEVEWLLDLRDRDPQLLDVNMSFREEIRARGAKEWGQGSYITDEWLMRYSQIIKSCVDMTRDFYGMPCAHILSLGLTAEAFTPLELVGNDP